MVGPLLHHTSLGCSVPSHDCHFRVLSRAKEGSLFSHMLCTSHQGVIHNRGVTTFATFFERLIDSKRPLGFLEGDSKIV